MRREDWQHIAGLTLVGLCSGIISSILIFTTDQPLNPFIPGSVFSLVIGIYFLSLQTRKALLSTNLFIIFSTASYVVVIYVIFHVLLALIFVMYYIFVLLAGIVGTALFLQSFKHFIFPLTSQEYKKLLFIGGILSAIGQVGFIFFPEFFSVPEPQPFAFNGLMEAIIFILIVWQTGMAAALGFVISKSAQVKVSTSPSKTSIFLGMVTLLTLYVLYMFAPIQR